MKSRKSLTLLLAVVLAVAFSALFAGCSKKESEDATSSSENGSTQEASSKEEESSTSSIVITIDMGETTSETETTTQESKNGMVRSYLSGKWVPEAVGKRRPVAVMLSNIMTAVPQSGIENADIVYETPVEGGITRLVAIFEDYDALEKIGSVRSARLYHVYIALEFDAIFAHYGNAIYADSLLAESFVHNISGTAGEGTVAYYRTTDRKAPHNAYTSASCLAAGISYKKYRTEYDSSYGGHFKFAEDDAPVFLAPAYAAGRVEPGYVNNSPWFEYNSEDGLYYRYEFKTKQIDAETQNQLAYKNIILQFVDYYDYGDGYYYIYNQGSGAGKFITNGKYIDITWKKDEEFGITRYYNEYGDEIILNQGKTWISFIFDSNADKVVIE